MTETVASAAETFAWDPSLPRRRLRTDLGTLVYTDAGNGAPVIFVHGYGDELFTWRYQLRDLRPQAHVYAFDLLGSGYSDKPASLAYDAQTFITTLYQFMHRLGIARASVVGSSLGAAAALCFAKYHPECIERLVLVGPTIPGVQPAGRFFDLVFWLAHHGQWGERLLQPGFSTAVRMALRSAVADATLITEELVRYYAQFAQSPGFKHAFTATARQWTGWQEHRPRFGELKVPLLVIWGEEDRIHPVRQARLLQTLIPHTRLLRLPRCGHWAQSERQAEVNQALRAFLLEHSNADGVSATT